MQRSIVIVGAGIVGCSLAYHLANLGVSDVVVIERGSLFETGGSTSHAPGVVFQVHPNSRTMTEFAKYSVNLYKSLAKDGQYCFLSVGGLEVATTPERLGFLWRKADVAASNGVRALVLSPEECAERFPLMEPNILYGGLFFPDDGLAKAIRAAQAMAEAAMQRGVCFRSGVSVKNIAVERQRVVNVQLSDGSSFRTDLLICCAGLWAEAIGRLVGLKIPLVPMQHPYVWTSPIPELAQEAAEARLPVLRHQDRSLYLRQHRDRLGIGSYRHEPAPIDCDSLVDTALAPFVPELFGRAWEDAAQLIPQLRRAHLERGINGVFAFTPDGMPLIGPTSVRGFWLVDGLWITHAAGGARAAAEWIVEGYPSWDLRECDPRRFEDYAFSRSFIRARSLQAYREVYDIVHPLQPPRTPRQIRTSPFYLRQKELGAVFLESAGWERPQWFESNAALLKVYSIPRRHSWAAQFWSPIVGAEHQRAREAGCVYDLSSLIRVEVVGKDATALLQLLASRNVDIPIGKVMYTLFLTPHGKVFSDVTIARLETNRYLIGCNSIRDYYWIQEHAADYQVEVRNLSGQLCSIGLWGPRVRDLLSFLEAEVPEIPYFGVGNGYIAEVPVVLMRLSYIGEFGYELLTTPDYGLRLWDLVLAAGHEYGIVPIGRGAFEGLRLEKGFRLYGKDVWAEHDPFDAGLGAFVDLKKTTFLGREELLRHRATASRVKLVCLEILDPEIVLLGGEPVISEEGQTIGFVTSGAFGYSIGRSLAFAWVDSQYANPETIVVVRQFRFKTKARTIEEPAFDPGHTRMRISRISSKECAQGE
jgi:glycine cleavage system aminomethyltransferase T/glycine/D-amino acid oxidase-like deaminating enzyme